MKFDFSQPLSRPNGSVLTGKTAGVHPSCFYTVEDWDKPLTLAFFLESVLLRTRPVDENDQPIRATDEEKLNRFALALKIRDGGEVSLTARDIETIKGAISVLPIEAYGIVAQALHMLPD